MPTGVKGCRPFQKGSGTPEQEITSIGSPWCQLWYRQHTPGFNLPNSQSGVSLDFLHCSTSSERKLSWARNSLASRGAAKSIYKRPGLGLVQQDQIQHPGLPEPRRPRPSRTLFRALRPTKSYLIGFHKSHKDRKEDRRGCGLGIFSKIFHNIIKGVLRRKKSISTEFPSFYPKTCHSGNAVGVKT